MVRFTIRTQLVQQSPWLDSQQAPWLDSQQASWLDSQQAPWLDSQQPQLVGFTTDFEVMDSQQALLGWIYNNLNWLSSQEAPWLDSQQDPWLDSQQDPWLDSQQSQLVAFSSGYEVMDSQHSWLDKQQAMVGFTTDSRADGFAQQAPGMDSCGCFMLKSLRVTEAQECTAVVWVDKKLHRFKYLIQLI